MKPEIPPVITDPCPLKWDGMKGDDKRRFCEHCQLHVHNLSRMNARERRAVLSSKGHVCVTYAMDENGALITQARHHWLFGFFSRFRTTALALAATVLPLGTSCTQRFVMGKPALPRETAQPPSTPSPKLVVPGGFSTPPPTPSLIRRS